MSITNEIFFMHCSLGMRGHSIKKVVSAKVKLNCGRPFVS